MMTVNLIHGYQALGTDGIPDNFKIFLYDFRLITCGVTGIKAFKGGSAFTSVSCKNAMDQSLLAGE